jgi:rRNA-processing protein FCF1
MFLLPSKYKVDIFEHLQRFSPDLYTTSSAVKELENLAKRKTKDAMHAKVGLQLLNTAIESNRIKIIRTVSRPDKAILDHVKKEKCMIATNDKELIKSLKKNKVKVIRLRQKKYLILE